MISFFRAPIKNITPQAQVSVLQIYKYITSDYAKLATDRLRLIADHYEARRYKSEMLDYVTFSGCFSSRRTGGLIEHSGFLCFDIDKIESEKRLQEIKSLLINDEELHTVLCFRSPSGNGLKWVVEVPDRYWLGVSHTENMPHTDDLSHTELTDNTEDAVASPASKSVEISRATLAQQESESLSPEGKKSFQSVQSVGENSNPEGTRSVNSVSSVDSVRNKNSVREEKNDVIVKNHKLLYERIQQYLFEWYGIATDHTSDIARPCYLCHDADAYYDPPTFKDNPASKLLTSKSISLEYQDKRSVLEILAKTNKNKNDYENDIEKIVRKIEHHRIDITNDYHDWMLVAMALAGTCGATGEHYFHRISQFHPKYDNAEAHRMYQSCVRNTHGAVGIGTIVYLIHNA